MEKYAFDENVVADAIVVQCGDPRFQEIFSKFLREELGVKHPAPISLAGSVSPVEIPRIAENHFRTLKNQLHFFLKHFPDARVVLINHENCKMYESIKQFFKNKNVLDQEKNDIFLTINIIKTLSKTPREINGFIARVGSNGKSKEVYFDKIA